MIINALAQYYDILAADSPDIPLCGYSKAKISFALNISLEGELLGIMDLREPDKKRMVPEEIIVPEQSKRSGQKPPAYFLCDKTEFVLGIDETRSEKAPERFASFQELHRKILQGIDDAGARAVLAFLDKWNPADAYHHPVLAPFLADILKGANFVFQLDGHVGYIHERAKIKKVWEDLSEASQDGLVAQCMVSGEVCQIERLHQNLKGIIGAQMAGVPLVTVNCDSFESYGKTQSYNSPIGKKVAFKYTTALNYLLASEEQKIRLGDTTTVFWAESMDKAYNGVAFGLFAGSAVEKNDEEAERGKRDARTEGLINAVFQCISKGRRVDYDQLGLDKEVQFYILGLSPNAGRVSVRYFYRDSFGKFIDRMVQHYQDISLVKRDFEPEQLPLRYLVNELAPKVGKERQVPPKLVGNLTRAIFAGGAYPTSVFQTLLVRIRSDQDDEKVQKKITYPRVAMIKGYLLRYARFYEKNYLKEVVTVGLNTESTNVAYRLGRLFALLERAQGMANRDLNATIKDRYFSSACAAPRTVFPTLLKLGQHHIAKIEKSQWLDKLMEEVIVGIDTLPASLNLEEQGLFVLGYYHQRHDLFPKKEQLTEEGAK